MSIHKGGEYKIILKINQYEINQKELIKFKVYLELGNIAPYCEITILTTRRNIYEQITKEMAPIYLEIQSLNKFNKICEKKKMRFRISNIIQNEINYNGESGAFLVTIRGIYSAWKYFSLPLLQISQSRKSIPLFLSELSDVFVVGESAKDGKIGLEIKDELAKKASDFMFWVAYDIPASNLVNQLLVRPVIKINNNSSTNKNEYIYTCLLDWDKEGFPKMSLYDLKLRTKFFKPFNCKMKDEKNEKCLSTKFRFTYKNIKPPDGIKYSSIKKDIKGADYSQLYWQRTLQVYDVEEHAYFYRRVHTPNLFEDSIKYKEPKGDEEEINNGEYILHPNYTKYKLEWYNTNHYNINYALQKFQVTTTLLALRKINIYLEFNDKFIKIKPIDICKIEINKGYDSENEKMNYIEDKLLSTNYMVTKVIWVYEHNHINTIVVASRDSISNKGAENVQLQEEN